MFSASSQNSFFNNCIAMAKPILLSLSLCLLLLSGCLAKQRQQKQQQQNACQFDEINALKPDSRNKTNGGVIETWNPNKQEFQCPGVALSRCTLEPNALQLPSYSNTAELLYIQEGEGYIGLVLPGCPETYEEPQSSQKQEKESSYQDRHQKIRLIRKGDLVAVPIGIVYWIYNEGPRRLVVVSLLDTANNGNQLDSMPRRFYLAGNQGNEFLQYYEQQGDQSQKQGQQSQQEGRKEKSQKKESEQEDESEENETRNIFGGFKQDWLEQALKVDSDIVKKIQGLENKKRGGRIIKLKEKLDFINPRTSHIPKKSQEEEEEEGQKQKHQQGGKPEPPSKRGCQNTLSETICTLRLKENIGEHSRPDIYNPEAGSIRVVNNLNLLVLEWLDLSAERGFIYENALLVPQYNLNAHGIVYALKGSAHIQVVDSRGKTVYDGTLKAGQMLLVPQNYAVAARTKDTTFEYVTFRTNGRAMTATLPGSQSLLRGLPLDVVAAMYDLDDEQAKNVKDNNENLFFVPLGESGRRQAV